MWISCLKDCLPLAYRVYLEHTVHGVRTWSYLSCLGKHCIYWPVHKFKVKDTWIGKEERKQCLKCGWVYVYCVCVSLRVFTGNIVSCVGYSQKNNSHKVSECDCLYILALKAFFTTNKYFFACLQHYLTVYFRWSLQSFQKKKTLGNSILLCTIV
jgi:hypothetical protein